MSNRIKELKNEQLFEDVKKLEQPLKIPEQILQNFEKSLKIDELNKLKEFTQEKKQMLEYEH